MRSCVSLGVALGVATLSAAARAEPPSAPAPASPPAIPVAPPVLASIALANAPPGHRYEVRSKPLLVLGVVAASLGGTLAGVGVAVYATADDPCAEGHPRGITSSRGLFCTADRSQFDVGMVTLVVGGTLFAVGVPMAVLGGTSASVAPPRVGLVPAPGGAAVRFVF